MHRNANESDEPPGRESGAEAPPPLELSHAVLLVADLQRMVDFYTSVLGFSVTDRGPSRRPGHEVVFLSASPRWHHQLAFVDARTDRSVVGVVDHLAFRCDGTLDHLRALERSLSASDGVTDVRTVSHGATWSVYFRDPEGNRVEVYVATPWHVVQPQGAEFDLSQSEATIAEWTQQTFGELPSFEPAVDYYARRRREAADPVGRRPAARRSAGPL
jgi:catechol 2,3-dioxygenase-like lactoylglutathione lyase family enzyme